MESKPASVYINASGEQGRAIAKVLVKFLAQFQIPSTYSDLPLGSNWNETLAGAMREAARALFVLTPDGLGSQWLLYESGTISGRGGHLVPLLFEVPPSKVPKPLTAFQALEFSAEGYRRLLNALLKELGRDLDDSLFAAEWERFSEDVKAILRGEEAKVASAAVGTEAESLEAHSGGRPGKAAAKKKTRRTAARKKVAKTGVREDAKRTAREGRGRLAKPTDADLDGIVEVAYRLVLNRDLEHGFLINPDQKHFFRAAERFGLGGSASLADVQARLKKEQGEVEPNRLWQGWVRVAKKHALAEIHESLSDSSRAAGMKRE